MTVDDPLDPIADLIVQRWGRATLPVQQIGGQVGTALFYNELMESTPDADRVCEWLVTADELTRSDAAEIRLRPELIEPAASDYLAMTGFGQLWSRRSGVAAMRTIGLHEHAHNKQWRWNTAQITDGVAARAEHIRTIDATPHKAYALGHLIAEPGQTGERRPLALATSNITRDPDRVVRWQGAVPNGFTGAPVFIAEHRGGRSSCCDVSGSSPAVTRTRSRPSTRSGRSSTVSSPIPLNHDYVTGSPARSAATSDRTSTRGGNAPPAGICDVRLWTTSARNIRSARPDGGVAARNVRQTAARRAGSVQAGQREKSTSIGS